MQLAVRAVIITDYCHSRRSEIEHQSKAAYRSGTIIQGGLVTVIFRVRRTICKSASQSEASTVEERILPTCRKINS